jgi:hypothetical protein
MPRKKSRKKRPNVASVYLSPAAKAQLDQVCESRGASIKALLGQLVERFLDLNVTEQSIVLGHVEQEDATGPAEMILRREQERTGRA